MNLVVVPPGDAAEPHSHRGFETAIYMLKGSVQVLFGPALSERLRLDAGQFLYMPADVPHQPVNLDPSEPAPALVARSDANEQESIEDSTASLTGRSDWLARLEPRSVP